MCLDRTKTWTLLFSFLPFVVTTSCPLNPALFSKSYAPLKESVLAEGLCRMQSSTFDCANAVELIPWNMDSFGCKLLVSHCMRIM